MRDDAPGILRPMYARYFGLKQSPFSIAPDPRYLFMSERHREALAHLLYGVRGGGGFVVLTGDIGAGKTTVCRCFLEQLPPRCNVAYIFNPKLSVLELLESICAEFRIPPPREGSKTATVKDYVDALNAYLLRTHAVSQNNLLIIDEAQNLSPDVLEQLRLLTNLETSERKLLQIVLIGQPELRQMLAQPNMQQLAQRVIARYHLGALTAAESVQYVKHRLTVAGLDRALPFDRPALRRIHRHSRGIPRRINLLCDRALLGAYAGGRTVVDARTLDQAAREVFDETAFPAPTPQRRRMAVGAAAVGIVVLVAGAVAAVSGYRNAARDDGASAAAVPAPSASGASGSGEAAARAANGDATAAPARPAAFDLPSGFASLHTSEDDALWLLVQGWQLPAGTGDPCAAAQKQQLRCFRSSNSTLALIRQLDRPAVLTLRDGSGRAAYALLDGLSEDHATLRIDGAARTVPLFALADYWRGEFVTFWRTPPGYAGAIVDRRSAAAPWLAQQLAAARGETLAPHTRFDDATLKGWVHAFQLTQGLPSDGVAGPATLMRLNRAIGAEEPRLAGGS